MRLLFIFLFLITQEIYSQNEDSINCDNNFPSLTKDSVYIKGKAGEKNISRRVFRKKVQLVFSDKSYTVEKFFVTWNDRNGNLYQRPNKGEILYTEIDEDIPDKKNYSLKSLEPGSYMTFDCIIVKKDGKYFKARSFLIRLTL